MISGECSNYKLTDLEWDPLVRLGDLYQAYSYSPEPCTTHEKVKASPSFLVTSAG